jgi:prepilin-type N-terminal cleavage/methylation domain-containing protein
MTAFSIRYRNPLVGFTLSELLISVAVIGVIAAFSIPPVVNAIELNKRKALLKETYASLSQIIYQGAQSGEMAQYNSWWSNPPILYVASKMNNVAKVCTGDILAQGCWSHGGNPDKDAMLLNNGVSIYFDEGVSPGGNLTIGGIYIDVNGPNQGPNTWWQSSGNDVIPFSNICFDLKSCPNGPLAKLTLGFPCSWCF